jgi:uncharacterized OB-fold protein
VTSQYPLPDVDAPDFASFWHGCAHDKLILPVCSEDHFVWPPRPRCTICRAAVVGSKEVIGRGRVFSWTVIHRSSLPEFSLVDPFAVAIISLAIPQTVRLVGRWIGRPDDVAMGMDAEVVFEKVTDRVSLPLWRPLTVSLR